MDTIFGVDGNWYLHRIYHTQPMTVRDPAAMICSRFVSMICKDAFAVRAKRILVAFDGERVFRYDIYPDYKGNREKSGQNPVYDYLGGLREYLDYCGIPNVQRRKHEGDDVLRSLAQTETNVVLGARDKDYYQSLIHDGITLYDSSFKVNKKPAPVRTTRKDVKAKFGVKASQVLDLQTLIGDRIDNVPTLVTRARAIKGLEKHGTLKAWMAADPVLRKELSKRREELLLNRKLVKLVSTLEVEVPPVKWNNDDDMVSSYMIWKQFCNPKSKGLF